ncbi:hypothetical protein EDB86DRAFT_2986630 [Lactarius hatsudake]|nr:hypothetical protein EDB86DRAFT_2986630 [Lactarius hatsudake]
MVTIGTVVEDGARRKGYSYYSCRVYVANGEFSSKIFKLGVISDLVCAFYAWGRLDAARQLESNRFKRPIDHVAPSIRNVQVDPHVQPDTPSRRISGFDSAKGGTHPSYKRLNGPLQALPHRLEERAQELTSNDDARRQSSAGADAYWANKRRRKIDLQARVSTHWRQPELEGHSS